MVTPFNAEKTLTKDTVPVDVDAVLFWVVWDAQKATLEVEGMGPLLAALAFPEIAPAADELERWLASSPDEPTRVQIMDSLIAMNAPNLPDVTFRWASSDRSPALRARAKELIVAHANIETLPQFPNALKPIAYRIAIQKGVRLLGSGLRHKVILANGVTYDGQRL